MSEFDRKIEVPFGERFAALFIIVLVATLAFIILVLIVFIVFAVPQEIANPIFLAGITPWIVLTIIGFFLLLKANGAGEGLRSLIRVVQGKERMD